jgi:hypothetical protein
MGTMITMVCLDALDAVPNASWRLSGWSSAHTWPQPECFDSFDLLTMVAVHSTTLGTAMSGLGYSRPGGVEETLGSREPLRTGGRIQGVLSNT